MQLSGREIPSTQPVRALGTNSRDDCVRVGASTSPCWAQMAGVEAGGCRGATSCHVHTAAPNLRKTPSISPNTHPSHHPPGWDGGGQHTGHSRARLVPRWAARPGAPHCQQHPYCTTAQCRGARRAEGTGKPRQPLLSPIILSRRGFIPPGSQAGAAAGCRGRAGWQQGWGISAGICPQPSRPAGKRGMGTCCTVPAALAGDAASPESPTKAQTRPIRWGSCPPALQPTVLLSLQLPGHSLHDV